MKKQEDLLCLSSNKVSLRDCCVKASICVHWDIRDALCSNISKLLASQSHLELLQTMFCEISPLIETLMADSTVYVLNSLLLLLNTVDDLGLSSYLDEKIQRLFLQHCSSFCEDSLQNELLTTLQVNGKLRNLADDQIYKKAFESDLCRSEILSFFD